MELRVIRFAIIDLRADLDGLLTATESGRVDSIATRFPIGHSISFHYFSSISTRLISPLNEWGAT